MADYILGRKLSEVGEAEEEVGSQGGILVSGLCGE